MATTFDVATGQGITESDDFMPLLWSDEIVASYKRNLVLANLVTNFDHRGRKGDSIQIPVPGRNAASVKAESSAVTLVNDTAVNVTISLSRHIETSMLIDDLASVQALDTMRQFYTDDLGYSIAHKVDDDLHTLGATFRDGTSYSAAVIGSDGSTAWSAASTGNGAALTDVGVRTMIQLLDDADVPEQDRFWVIPPVEKKNLLGLSRYTEQAFIGEGGSNNSIRTGLVGNLYGAPVYVSTNCADLTNTSGSVSYRAGIYAHKSAMALVTQLGMRVQRQYQQQFLADLITADMVYGYSNIDTGATATDYRAVAFIVPA